MNKENNAFCSFSGGKDSCLALHRALKEGIKVKYLFTMFKEDGQRSRGHGLKPEIIKKQAELLDMDLIYGEATWEDYENVFKEKMCLLEKEGAKIGVFGDIDIDDHREWVVKACDHTEIEVYHPIWQESRRKLIEEFVDLGFKAIIVTLNGDVLSKDYLGRVFDKTLIKEFEQLGIDACGENGEFHTIVIDGPIFKEPLKFARKDVIKIQNYYMLDLDLN
ncbi:diphthine--ammonia ligase [Abyssisolibacter fermentans]|uniref:Dph6-related ATP pyrophosphatase n=1 Tax=Abyssisolibacter fermentans TaxID=1766203 RepID=UPI00082FF6B3|nr:diphthine--ammonia ligase [Abyssisolibacter fermentans]